MKKEWQLKLNQFTSNFYPITSIKLESTGYPKKVIAILWSVGTNSIYIFL